MSAIASRLACRIGASSMFHVHALRSLNKPLIHLYLRCTCKFQNFLKFIMFGVHAVAGLYVTILEGSQGNAARSAEFKGFHGWNEARWTELCAMQEPIDRCLLGQYLAWVFWGEVVASCHGRWNWKTRKITWKIIENFWDFNFSESL